MTYRREKLRPRDELVRLAWLAHGGHICLVGHGLLGKYVDAVLWGPASDIDELPKGSQERLNMVRRLFASGAMSLAAELGADVDGCP